MYSFHFTTLAIIFNFTPKDTERTGRGGVRLHLCIIWSGNIENCSRPRFDGSRRSSIFRQGRQCQKSEEAYRDL